MLICANEGAIIGLDQPSKEWPFACIPNAISNISFICSWNPSSPAKELSRFFPEPSVSTLYNRIQLPEESLSIARRLREHCKYDGKTPLVIMPEKVPQNLEGTDERINDLEWICYYEDVDQLKRLLARLLN